MCARVLCMHKCGRRRGRKVRACSSRGATSTTRYSESFIVEFANKADASDQAVVVVASLAACAEAGAVAVLVAVRTTQCKNQTTSLT